MIFPKIELHMIILVAICITAITYSQPNVYVDPPNQVVYGQKTVTINFRINNAVNIRTYGVLVKWNNSIIKFKSAVKSTFLNNNGTYSTFFSTQPSGSYILDSVTVAESILGAGIAVSGSGLLFSIQFDILSIGQSPITIKAITLYDINNYLAPGTFTSGLLTISGKVLVVDDDVKLVNKESLLLENGKLLESSLGSSASLFTSSLTNAGYFVDQVNFSSMNITNLINYDFVILSAGVKESEIFNNNEKRTALVSYIRSGGKIFVEGGNVGYVFRKDDLSDPDPEFRRNILLDSTWVSDRIGVNLQITNSNHPIFKTPNVISSPITVNNGGVSGSGARDEMTLIPQTGVSRIANWVGGPAENGGIIIYNTNGDTAKCRNIFFTFSIANLADQTLAGKLIVNSAKYLMREKEPPIKILNLKAFIEGFYSGTSMVPDTVLVEFRETSSPYTLIESKKVFLDTLGACTEYLTSVKDWTPYYIAIKHRSSIETWSSTGRSFTSGYLNYDFTTDSAKAFGNNMKKKGTKWCIFSGDVNQDGFANSTDLALIANDAYYFSVGYKAADLNGNNFIELSDLIICDNNTYNLVRSLKP
jgi:hypothetical protein